MERKICVECKWYKGVAWLGGVIVAHRCSHPQVVDRVTGRLAWCKSERSDSMNWCGSTGRRFEPKENQ